LLVASCRSADLLFGAKDLFFAARTVITRERD
jgi:hypothetical protein